MSAGRISSWLAAAAALLFLVSSPARGEGAEPDYSRDPVLMVHGYLLAELGSWTWMKSRLVQEGWPAEYLFSFKFDDVFGCNPKHAQEVEENVKKVLEATGKEKVDIVCHSMGCLDTRYYIKYMCGYKFIKDFVSIAGAHKGSAMACLEPLSCGAKQMCVAPYDGAWLQNDFLKELNMCDITAWDEIKYTSIWTPYDEIIIPQTNSIIEGAYNVELTALVEHGLILANEETATYVIEGLDGGGKNDNMPTSQPPCVVLCEDDLVEGWEPPPESAEPVPDRVELLYEYLDEPDAVVSPPFETVSSSDGLVPGPGRAAGDGSGTAGEATSPAGQPDEDPRQRPHYLLPAGPPDGCGTGGSTSPLSTALLLLACLACLAARKMRGER